MTEKAELFEKKFKGSPCSFFVLVLLFADLFSLVLLILNLVFIMCRRTKGEFEALTGHSCFK